MWLLKKLFKKRDEMTGDGDIVKPFLDHLEDLRFTLMKMISTLAITMMVAFAFRKSLAGLLRYPLLKALGPDESTLISITPIESVSMSFTLAFYAGIVVSFPILFYFLAEFLLPALTKKEKKYVMPAVGVGFGLFLTGVVLCFLYVLPVTLKWLHSDVTEFHVKPSWTMKEYYGFITHLCIAVGLVCELPVVMVTLSFIDLISYKWLKGFRMYGYAIALVLAGIISPTPDLFMLFIFALPIMLLFESCIWMVWLIEKRRAKEEKATEALYSQPADTEQHDPYHDSYHHDSEHHDGHPHDSEYHDTDYHGEHHQEPHAEPAALPPHEPPHALPDASAQQPPPEPPPEPGAKPLPETEAKPLPEPDAKPPHEPGKDPEPPAKSGPDEPKP